LTQDPLSHRGVLDIRKKTHLAATVGADQEIHLIDLGFILPSKPTQNSHIERFNRTYRTEVIDMYAFRDLE
jgi:putative transposase